MLAGGYDNTNFEIDAESILAAWARGRGSDVGSILTAAVLRPATDLSQVPNAVLANGTTMVSAGSFGPAIGNDADIDLLSGGLGKNFLARGLVSGRSDNDDIGPAQGVDQTFRLMDTPVSTMAVSQLVGVTTSSGADVIGQPARTVYAFGRFDTDTGNVIPAMGYPKVPDAQFSAWYGVETPARVVNLNMVGTTPGDFWAQFNRPYVGFAMGFQGRLVMVSDILDPMNYTGVNSDNSINPLPGRRREFDYLLGLREQALHATTNGQMVTYAYDALRKIMYAVGQ